MICDACNGKGYVEIEQTCRICNGTGKAKGFDPKITAELNEEQLKLFMKGICGVCKGSGKIKSMEVCKVCNRASKAAI